MKTAFGTLLSMGVAFMMVVSTSSANQDRSGANDEYVFVPEIVGEWWQVTGNPDLGERSTDRQQPVDFGIWQAKDGTWQIWSCIRDANVGDNKRLLYGWEAENFTDTEWTPMGVKMEADTSLGEVSGGLQAPHVIIKDGIYYMLYGGWGTICLAKSEDGKNFERVINESGTAILFSGPMGYTRDAMTLQIGDTYYCYYTAHLPQAADTKIPSAIWCRTSKDLHEWSEATMVSGGGSVKGLDGFGWGDAECPFVVPLEDKYILFRNQIYGPNNLNTQYVSADPMDFGVDSDEYMVSQLKVAAPEIFKVGDQYYMAALNPNLDGIRIAKLKFNKVNKKDIDLDRLIKFEGKE